MKWLCFQIGRREHYAIPRALARRGEQVSLITDYWADENAPFNGLLRRVPGPWRDRTAVDDFGAVKAFNASCLLHEVVSRISGGGVFQRALRRNAWFEKCVARHLRGRPSKPDVIFTYSYAADAAISYGKANGIPVILGQIDGGLHEEIYLEGCGAGQHKGATPAYWDQWKRQVEAASVVVVNSEWSAECLLKSGCAVKRIEIVPLAYEGRASVGGPSREMPAAFTAGRPLRLLFLGQVIARKGVVPLLEALDLCQQQGLPVECWFVGVGDAGLIAKINGRPNARYCGIAGVGQVVDYYRAADMLILPTFSDGFALTQLEAQAQGLPVIASRNCGRVVESGRNGMLLDTVEASSILSAIKTACDDAGLVKKLQEGSRVDETYAMSNIGRRYQDIARSILGNARPKD